MRSLVIIAFVLLAFYSHAQQQPPEPEKQVVTETNPKQAEPKESEQPQSQNTESEQQENTETEQKIIIEPVIVTDYQDEIDSFFELYQQDQINEAIDFIYRSNQYITTTSEQVSNRKTQLSTLKSLVGKIHHIDKIDTYKVGDNFVHITYLVIYDRQPIRYEFQFFKITDSWKIYSFAFDDHVTIEIAELARKAALSSNK
ncbi:hypothetical protein [Thalassotalea maritima]|uniref:hypothetical protein n=1 Tax=Thalassotalea maritima TaxID=3242416 RepID=UPI0035294FC3